MRSDDCYEALAWLASLDQISTAELSRLATHMSHCATCRATFDQIDAAVGERSADLNVFSATTRIRELAFGPEPYMRRFMERAEREGIRFSRQVGRRVRWNWIGAVAWKPAVAVLCVLSLALVMVGLREQVPHKGRPAPVSTELVAAQQPVGEVTAFSSKLAAAIEARQAAGNRLADAVRERQNAEHELETVRAAGEAEAGHRRRIEQEVAVLQTALDAAKTSSAQAIQHVQDLESRIARSEKLLAQAGEEVQQLRSASQRDSAALSAQQDRVVSLDNQLRTANEKLSREESLLAANRDIRDLMGARNLHLIDVLDVRGSKTGKTFGRIFYTEGKSLIFYLFDPGNTLRNAHYSFQAWGYREPAVNQAHNLGIFYHDDETQKRWMLKIEDPAVLEHIDAVFVTLEPNGTANRPGKKLLYAFLKGQPNHP